MEVLPGLRVCASLSPAERVDFVFYTAKYSTFYHRTYKPCTWLLALSRGIPQRLKNIRKLRSGPIFAFSKTAPELLVVFELKYGAKIKKLSAPTIYLRFSLESIQFCLSTISTIEVEEVNLSSEVNMDEFQDIDIEKIISLVEDNVTNPNDKTVQNFIIGRHLGIIHLAHRVSRLPSSARQDRFYIDIRADENLKSIILVKNRSFYLLRIQEKLFFKS
ncbi:unnamed protein product [Trichogramma brassicae]|uniref:Uncharacterized protein n=1 Tax=Trichogramma brassicae TaxID=86971 RepID=A0A6H5I442_9HYME|nr:unnamed protein product [Trichogramma brassicae]